tara:strand:+ start:165 stop:1331 length:1167 start_codon:yes stop_codon:yes gene_type:complete
MLKEIFIFGDTELGGGTLTDDFISDQALTKEIIKLSKIEGTVDLVFNGDSFDFLKCPYIINNKVTYPRHITNEVSLAKLRLIYKAHSKVFKALEEYLKNEKHHLYFIIGNHDPDLVFPKVQNELRNLINGTEYNVHFNFSYLQHNVHIEHGHQLDFLNKVDINKLFLNYKNNKILNIPWVSLGIKSNFLSMKEKHPFLERIHPRPTLFIHHKSIFKEISWRSFEYFLKSIIYYPLRHYNDPTYAIPRGVVRKMYSRIKKIHWEVENIVEIFKKINKGKLSKNRLYIFGHVHKKYMEEKSNWTILLPDTWRDEYFMDNLTRKLIPKNKQYLHVKIDHNNEVSWDFIDCPIERSSFHFDDVIRDEYSFLSKAANEENFQLYSEIFTTRSK